MKKSTGLITVIFSLAVLSRLNAQSTINGLSADDIRSIRIIQQSSWGFTDDRGITDEKNIRQIIYYLKKYDYQDFGLQELDNVPNDMSEWKYRIIFDGWRDEIFLYDDKVSIGESVFRLPPGMIREFDSLFRDL